MRAVYYETFGSAEILKLGERPIPDPGPGQVLVKVAATSVNPIDRRLRAGELQPYFHRIFPIIPGWDVAGRIVKLGPDTSGWAVGDAVAGLAFSWFLQHGTYAEYVPISVTAIARKPDQLSFNQAAALPLVALTAWQALVEESELQRGQSVFIQAGAGGLGSAAIAIAKHCGATVYTTARGANADYVRMLGADRVIDHLVEDYLQILPREVPGGVDVVIEALQGDRVVNGALTIVKDGGSIIYVNNDPPTVPDFVSRNIHSLFIHHRADGAMLGGLLERYAYGALALPEIEVWPLDRAVEAHLRSESGRTRGKLVLEVARL